MIYFYLFTIVCILFSFSQDRAKTYRAFKIAWKKFQAISSAFMLMLIFVSILLYLIPEGIIIQYLGGAGQIKGLLIAVFFGSVAIMPGFVAFPLCGILLKKGVSYMVLAAFSNSLMLVGIVTYPIEKAYFGTKVTIIRNLIFFLLSLLVAILIGMVYKELFI
jgi:uncharacterized membrane protein YraQ (UPF0718 family)